MSEALQRVLNANRREVKLEDGGLIVGYHLPDIQECLLAGDVPLPALKSLPSSPTEDDIAEAVGAADMSAMLRQSIEFKKRLVGAMLNDIDGIPIGEDDNRILLAEAFSPEQRDELFAIAQREKDPNSGKA